jgi:LmbE family N-acetylglucosaminyl deacetylase
MIVAAHPDDETLGIGSLLCLLDEALLVHVTDGAPRDGADARVRGFATCAEYADARRAELAKALAVGDAGHIRCTCLDIADQQAVRSLVPIARGLVEMIAVERPAVIFTHAYEGGHPDHDAAAFAVHAACRLLRGCGHETPAIVEFALYCRVGGPLADFPLGAAAATTIVLDEDELRRKRAMIASFASQLGMLEVLDPSRERLRMAPDHDFSMPPPTGGTGYDDMGWGIDGPAWRREAGAALEALGLS